MTDDLLPRMGGSTSGRLRLELRPLNPREMVEHVVETSRPAATAKTIQLELHATPTAKIMADPDRLQQIVWNLVSNAIKFTPERGRVDVTIAPSDGHVDIVVTDTGVGIPSEFLPHVFERFRQADSSTTRRYGGLGLGLAIVRHLTELHGGAVSADSAGPGKGATFRLRYPAGAATSD